MEHKTNCGFRRVGVCLFKPEDCNSDKCDMFNLLFTSDEINIRMQHIKDDIEELQKKTLDMPRVKAMLTLETKDPNHPDCVEYRKQLRKLKDLHEGYKYLNIAYRYCKRANLRGRINVA